MPIKKRWTTFTLANIEKLPVKCGLYELGDKNGEIIYIGKSDSRTQGTKGRLLTHFRNKAKQFPNAKYFRTAFVFSMIDTGSDMEYRHTDKFKQSHTLKPSTSKRLPRRTPGLWI